MLKSAEEFLEWRISNEDVLECPRPTFLMSEELRDMEEDAGQTSDVLDKDAEDVLWWGWSDITRKTCPGRESEVAALSLADELLLSVRQVESFLSVLLAAWWSIGGTAKNKAVIKQEELTF